jgi:membrane-bound metal-dependent hydrolase YbcI (DUF457 family)
LDNLTHSLFGLTLAQTPLRRAGRGATLTLMLASNAPDSDIVVAMTRGGAAYLSAHRGSSHGPLGVIGLAFVAAALAYGSFRWRELAARRHAPSGDLGAAPGSPPRHPRGGGPASFLSLVGLALIGTLAHVLMDLPTPYGTRSLSPFDRTWYTIDWMPIIDAYLLGLLGAGLAAVRLTPTARTTIASVVLLLVAANYSLRAELHRIALRQATAGQAARATLSAWPDLPSPKLPSDHACDREPCALATAALPTFGSPFRWRIVRQFSNGYRLSDVDLWTRTEEPIRWMAHEDGAAVQVARETADSLAFLAFSRFPAARVERLNRETIVRMSDVRFLDVPVSRRGEEFRPGGLFAVMVRLDPHGKILEARFGN